VVIAVGGWHLLKGRADNKGVRTMFSMGLWLVLIVAPIQVVLGDAHGLNTLHNQPAKVMAMEGHYESYPDGAPLYLFGIPNEEEQRLDYAVGIPKLSSLILKHDPNAPMPGLDTIPEENQPPVGIVFFAFRIMVAIGFLMVAMGLWGAWARWRGRLYTSRWLHRAAVAMGPSGLVAVISGWLTTEVGRQPFTVYGFLRTADSASPIAASAVGTSLVAFVIIYFVVFGAGVFYIFRLMSRPPEVAEPDVDSEEGPIRTAGLTTAPQLERGRGRGHRPHPAE
jgi:cytochrome d ubiquinol oxidase subunit I